MPRLFRAALAALSLAATVALPATAHAADPARVAIIVGPVGSLTPTYLALAERAAATAEQHGAVVARAYSPHATPANVLAAVADANVVIYFGHGWGHPSPYGGLNRSKMNGWGLQGPRANGTHGDAGGQIAYYGEDWIVANARPAAGFVMIYSNTCYAPGASEGGHAPATPSQAAGRVAHYSRATFSLGGSAYYATDFDRGAADLVARILGNRGATYGSAFVSDHRYVPSGLSIQAHPFSAGQQIWLHRSKYTDGPPNYWYAFAGNPDLTPLRAWDPIAPTVTLESPAVDAVDVHPDATISLRASEPVSGVSAQTVSLLDAAGAPVPATVTHDAASGEIQLRPDAPLLLSHRYRVSVGAGIADAAGNALVPAGWSFWTRLDADPLSAPLPVVLEPGTHELVRFGVDGSPSESRSLELSDQRWLVATTRARLDGRTGSWLQLGDGGLEGWWVAESPMAHAVGTVEEVALRPGTTILLRAQRYTVSTFADGAMASVSEMAGLGDRPVAVDRRVVVDGKTYVRLALGAASAAGQWVATGPASALDEAAVIRRLGAETRVTPATISMSLGDWPAYRFDAGGRVVERRTVRGVDAQGLATSETLLIGGRRFAVISGGELHGWAIEDDPRVTIVHAQPAPEPRG